MDFAEGQQLKAAAGQKAGRAIVLRMGAFSSQHFDYDRILAVTSD
jgi:hypothetical protein|tara:strand:- start:695 stop:829 length:135 start_codon:yes stop_codon:yes gene_type:complete